MKILITGSAGFIGFNLSEKLCLKYQCMGIDNFNDYYDVNLKHARSKILKSKGFITKKIDISSKSDLDSFLNKNEFDVIIHLAAQAGVRYSIENPNSYVQSNLIGTFNILESIKNKKIKHLLIASTSSIYGSSKKVKLSEAKKSDEQISLYSSTKKSIENIAHSYSYTHQIPITIMRFFTVYGPWGRPDMALFKFVNAIMNDEAIDVYNNGNMWRDFTYIDDLVKAIQKLIHVIPDEKNRVDNDSLSTVAPFRIVNTGNQNAVSLNYFIEVLEGVMKKKAKRKNLPMQLGDVSFTLSDSSLLKNLIDYAPSTKIEKGIKNFYNWYKLYYQTK